MAEKQPISADQKRGREEGIAAWAANRNCTDEQFEHEKDYYLNVPIIEKTAAQSDNEAIRSTNALLAIRRKDVEATEQSLIRQNEIVEKLKGTTISIS